MGKLIKVGVIGLAMYGGCVLLDKYGKRYLRNHRKEIMDKIDYLLFGPDEEKSKKVNYGHYYKPYADYATHAKVTN